MKKLIVFVLLVFPLLIFAQRPEMVTIEGGTFTMGNMSSPNLDEKPMHQVTLSSFKMAKYEVTFDEFDFFCNSTGYTKPNDGGFGRGKLPVVNISWQAAIMYCNWMSRRFNLDKVYKIVVDSTGMHIKDVDWSANGFRLPTEAEWEYVASGSAGTGTSYPLDEVAWYAANSNGMPHEVGTAKPNSAGIFDIIGNAWEWCWDAYAEDYYEQSPANDPHGPDKGLKRMYRGGNFEATQAFLNPTKRYSLDQELKNGMVGLRLVQNAN